MYYQQAHTLYRKSPLALDHSRGDRSEGHGIWNLHPVFLIRRPTQVAWFDKELGPVLERFHQYLLNMRFCGSFQSNLYLNNTIAKTS